MYHVEIQKIMLYRTVSWNDMKICEGEVIVIIPHLLGESAQGILLLNLREDEGQEEVLEDKDEEEEESEVDEKVKESQRERSTHACDMVMTMGWNETQTQTS